VTISRRNLLKTGFLTCIVTGTTLKLTGLAATRPPTGTDAISTSLDYYSKATFQSYLNSDFRIYAHEHSETWLRLVLVEDFPTRESTTAPNECFRLLFSASAESALSQGTYSVDHAALGSFALFIVPGKPLDGKVQYEAVFNRRFSSDVAPTVIPNTKQPGKKRPAGWETDTIAAPDSGKQIVRPSSALKVNDW
jgi:hypothetical protein